MINVVYVSNGPLQKIKDPYLPGYQNQIQSKGTYIKEKGITKKRLKKSVTQEKVLPSKAHMWKKKSSTPSS